jgi:hypothetical protein
VLTGAREEIEPRTCEPALEPADAATPNCPPAEPGFPGLAGLARHEVSHKLPQRFWAGWQVDAAPSVKKVIP